MIELVKKNFLKKNKSEVIAAIVLLLPSFVLLTMFTIIPLGYSFVSSFFDNSVRGVSVFVGFKTYGRIIKDLVFWQSMWHGVRYALLIVPIQLTLAFLIASLITKLKKRLNTAFRVFMYIPCVLSGVVVGVIFSGLFQEDNGLINAVLMVLSKPFEAMGAKKFEPIPWLFNVKWSWVICAFAVIWAGLGYTTLIMLGGLYDIPIDHYEAATIDGAGRFAKLWYITLPGLKNVLIYLLISLVVSAIQVFEIPYIMTGKGPLNSTMGPIGYIYDKNYDTVKDMATTASLVIGILLASLSTIIFRAISSEKSEA